jgi:hypothetical protein
MLLVELKVNLNHLHQVSLLNSKIEFMKSLHTFEIVYLRDRKDKIELLIN